MRVLPQIPGYAKRLAKSKGSHRLGGIECQCCCLRGEEKRHRERHNGLKIAVKAAIYGERRS